MAREWNEDLLEEIDIDVDALVAACAERAEYTIFQDSYGSGVALYHGESFPTYHALAARFGLDAAKFQRQ